MSIKDTICAIATPPGHGGIGIVRISGPEANSVLEKIWEGKTPSSSFESHKMYLGKIFNPTTNPPTPPFSKGGTQTRPPFVNGGTQTRPPFVKGGEGGFIDTVLAVWMKGPNSYTGEDVVEISCHGGPAILERMLNACRGAGARPAHPGEFTKRAFLNGKMDLAQAEAVSDLISATSDCAARIAGQQLEGRLSREINVFLDELTKVRAFVEASIDFPEEDIEFIENEGIAKRLFEIASKVRALSDSYDEGHILRDGVRIAIVGKPNVGKSSLFNALVGHGRAIVHHASGTTRDLVTETIQMGGIAFHLTDAAGLCESDHDVERIGIEKARGAIDRADLILFVMDGSLKQDEEDQKIYESLDLKRAVVCMNKSDLLDKQNPPTPPFAKGGQGGICAINVSALKCDGIETLKEILIQKVKTQTTPAEGVIITSARHKALLDQALSEIENAVRVTNERQSAEFIAHHLRQAHELIGQIIGNASTEVVLDQIFSCFCIGK